MNQPMFSVQITKEIIELDNLCESSPTSHIFDYNIEPNIGKGNIRFLKLNLGFRIIEIDATFKSNTQLNLYNNSNYIYFLYCTEGSVYHTLNNQSKLSAIDELNPSIIGCNLKDDACLLLKYNKPTKLNMICIDKSIFFEDYKSAATSENDALSKTDKLIKSLNTIDDSLYVCAKNLQLAECLRAIKPMEIEDDFIEILNAKSKYQKILALHLNEFYKELYEERNDSNLNTNELQQVRKVSEFVIDNLEIQHSIKSLCRQSGLSPAKMQEGFKSMHNTTVSDFIRNKRLEKAESLFKTSEYNVSEVVYMVGITSRSYFCKIFKSKFGYSPSTYIKMNRENNTILNS